MTRAEAVAILLLARNPEIPAAPNEGLYRDLAAGSWYEKPMLAGARLGIVAPDPNTQELRPNELLNRAELLKMMSAAFGLTSIAADFQDVPADAWYAHYTGLARRYLLFPEDYDALNFKAEKLVTFHEAVLAVQAVLEEKLQAAAREHLSARVVKIGGNQLIVAAADGVTAYVAEPPEQASLPSPDIARPGKDRMRTELVRRVNAIRTLSGLHPLRYHAQLEASAQAYANDMATRGYFSHVSPEGAVLRDRVTASGYYKREYSPLCLCIRGYAVGENLARGQQSVAEAVNAWMDSPKHRGAILNQNYTHTGVGVSPEAALWVEHFGGYILAGEELIGG